MNAFRRLALAAAVLGCAASGVLAPAAGALYVHKPLFQLPEIPAEGPLGETVAFPGRLERMESMIVDSNHLWVAEATSAGERSRVDEFDATTGAFIAQPMHAEKPTVYGEQFGTGIAVGHGPGQPLVYVGGKTGSTPVVSLFSEAGALKASWTGTSVPGGSFGGNVTGVAVDNSTNPLDPAAGDVYVAIGPQNVIDVFHPEAEGEERYVGQITGTAPGKPFNNPWRVAVDQGSGEVVVQNGWLGSGNTVAVLKPNGMATYELSREVVGLSPTAPLGKLWTTAVDSANGEIYVTEFPSGSGQPYYRFDQFGANGAYDGGLEEIGTLDPYAIAVDPESPGYLYMRNEVYSANVVIPDVVTNVPANLKPESVVLSGTVNPDGEGAATCRFEWGTSPSFGHTTPCAGEIPNGTSSVPVQVALNGLERGVTYYYRLEATNKNGTNTGESRQTVSFYTPGAVVRSESVLDVAADSATLEATVNPNSQATGYYFQYGPTAAYGSQTPATAQAVGSGTADIEVSTRLGQGLSAGAEYHYRAVLLSEAKPGELETVYGEDRTFTTQPAKGAFSLLDERQWEMVTPPDKLGALVEPLKEGAVQAAAAGDAIAYRTNSPGEAEPQGYSRIETALSARGASGWTSLDISPPHSQAGGSEGRAGSEFQVFSSDLTHAALRPISSEFTALSPEASESTPYLRTDFPAGEASVFCREACYQPLVTRANDTAQPFAPFGEEPHGYCEKQGCGPLFWGASPDLSHLIISSPAQLTETPAPAGGEGLYEWSAGRLQLVDVLPKGEEGPAILAGSGSGDLATGVRHAVSSDGNQVILEGGAVTEENGIPSGGGGLYLRDVAAGETTRLDVVQGGTGPSQGEQYATASADASRIFFLDRGHLTPESSSGGEDLYEYDANAPAGRRLTDLSVDGNSGEPAEVKTVIGASEDGTYVYFVASGVLAPGARTGALNLYVSHEGVTKLVASVPSEDSDFLASEHLFARVSPNGEWLAFMSRADLTGYDTRDAVSGHPDAEVYLYGASSGRLECASCNPTGARPVGVDIRYEGLVVTDGLGGGWVAANVTPWLTVKPFGIYVGTFYQPRYLSDSGRLFFDSADALVSQDVNGAEDVYEYEPAGAGNCSPSSAQFAPRSNGCVGLVSGGTSPAESGFLDASESGGDVFFITQAQLAPQDYDTAYDVYDAQECTSGSSCPPVPAPQPSPCETEASCRAAPSPQPALYGAPASATFTGTGNAPPSPAATVTSKSKQKPKKARCKRGRGRRRCRGAKKKALRTKRANTKASKSRRGGGR